MSRRSLGGLGMGVSEMGWLQNTRVHVGSIL